MQITHAEEQIEKVNYLERKISPREIDVEKERKRFSYYFIKRIIDVIFSLCGIIIFSLLFLIIGIAVKLDSNGPVFFAHKRLGKNGKEIKVYKFRTMISNAEELLMSMDTELKKKYMENFKLDNDPRITKLGNILRKTSLDELPQLFNILIGNMSIVGPRPIVEEEKEKYGIYIDKFLSVKPGLTGNWQVNGRSSTTYAERVRLDMEYIDKRSILLDFVIIFKTVGCVLKKDGAY